MRTLRVLIVVAALGFGWTAPVAAQAQVETPGWGWEALAERLTGWVGGAWSVVAGAVREAPPQPDHSGTDPLTVDRTQETTASSSSEEEVYPGLDPNG